MFLTPHHVALTVSDIEESITWYEKHLGFLPKGKRIEKKGFLMQLVEQNNFHIELIQPEDGPNPLPEGREVSWIDVTTIGTKHICLETPDLDGAVKNLREHGVTIANDISPVGFGGRKAFIKDCNGILIELYQRD